MAGELGDELCRRGFDEQVKAVAVAELFMRSGGGAKRSEGIGRELFDEVLELFSEKRCGTFGEIFIRA